jgi:hypothetical protein
VQNRFLKLLAAELLIGSQFSVKNPTIYGTAGQRRENVKFSPRGRRAGGRVIRMASITSLERFQAQPKWEIPGSGYLVSLVNRNYRMQGRPQLKPHQKLLVKGALGLGLVGVLIFFPFDMATGGKYEIASYIFLACQFVMLSTILIVVLTLRQITLTKVTIGLAVEGILILAAFSYAGAVAWGVFAIFEIAALACVVIALIKVSKNSNTPRTAKTAKVILQLFFPFVGLIVGVICSTSFFNWLLCTHLRSRNHMDPSGLVEGLSGAIGGFLLGHWLVNRLDI